MTGPGLTSPAGSAQGSPAAAQPGAALTTGSLAALLGAELQGPPDLPVTHVDALERAAPGAITFIRSAKFAARWASSSASAALVTRGLDVPGHDAARRALLLVPDADLALNTVLEAFASRQAPEARLSGVHGTAAVELSATVDPTAWIGPLCRVGPDAHIGAGACLVAGVSVGRGVRIGRHCVLHPGSCVYDRCTIGDGCILHAGAVIGADGFGYRPAPDGRGVVKIPHIGTVELGAGVEVGANSCIDRAKFGVTRVGAGTKIDNLVQIGHNCDIGRACLICGLVGIAGSVTLGDGVIVGGQAGIKDNVTIGPGARIGAHAGVECDVPAGEAWSGYPARPHIEDYRLHAFIRRLYRQRAAGTGGARPPERVEP